MRSSGLLLLSAAVCALVHSAPAWAQANPDASSGAEVPAGTGARPEPDTLGAIVVTAQRREENLQDVPIAATAFRGDQLQAGAVISDQWKWMTAICLAPPRNSQTRIRHLPSQTWLWER